VRSEWWGNMSLFCRTFGEIYDCAACWPLYCCPCSPGESERFCSFRKAGSAPGKDETEIESALKAPRLKKGHSSGVSDRSDASTWSPDGMPQ